MDIPQLIATEGHIDGHIGSQIEIDGYRYDGLIKPQIAIDGHRWQLIDTYDRWPLIATDNQRKPEIVLVFTRILIKY